ncbi:hypothetical protein CMO88_01705 [Candidatus Woesearchaeota archaeon]|nr:hypothetical protein [Candidatus Woesearchaeota archaeon]|tara:strand:+ start:22234 stop:23022 length:789 start_codon:yes stop_codon:yes gene_type:complete
MVLEFLDIIKVLPPVGAIVLISFFISILITIVYKFTTNQKFMKELHAEMKSLRQEIKNTKDTAQATALNKRLMEKTMQQVMQSMKSTFITIIPIFMIFGWLSGNLAFAQVTPDTEFTASITFDNDVTSTASIESETLQILTNKTESINQNTALWKLKGEQGTHEILYTFEDETYARDVIITNDWQYADPHLEKERTLFGIINLGDKNPIKPDSKIKRVAVDLQPTRPFGNFELFGWKPGWLATYFFFTLLLTFPIRKLMKVH